ncbi:MAG: hypothetical protein ACHQ49_13565 [Elusimicrobiota bacterium]
MRSLLLFLLLAPAAGALDAERPGAPAARARDAIEALPVEARVELRRMYMAYAEEVAARVDQGWTPGLLSDAVIEDVDDPFQPGRLLEDADNDHRRKSAAADAELAKLGADSAAYAAQARRADDERKAYDGAHRRNARGKGICRDWSDDVWFILARTNPDEWAVDDRRRGARPYHSAAVACSPQENPSVCLAFDPWAEGKPSMYAYPAWDAKEPGGRLPAEFFLHGLPEKSP